MVNDLEIRTRLQNGTTPEIKKEPVIDMGVTDELRQYLDEQFGPEGISNPAGMRECPLQVLFTNGQRRAAQAVRFIRGVNGRVR